MRNTVIKPKQRRSLERPADRNPLTRKLDRENQRNEKQRHSAVDRKPAESARMIHRIEPEDGDQTGKRWKDERGGQQTHHVIRPGVFHDAEDEQEKWGRTHG